MPTQLRSLAATLLIAVPALCHSAQTALAQNNPGGAAAPPAMLCQGPEGLYRVSYDAETGFVDFNGESYPVMMPPEDAGGIAMIWEEGPVLIGLAAMWVRYESLDGMRTLRQDRCRAVPASTARPGGEATVPLSEVQRLLNQLGFDAGAVDGVMGPRTRRAIAEFQRSIGEDGTGRLSVAQAARLAETAGAARAAHGDSQDGGEAAPASPGTARPTFQDCDVCPVMLELPPGVL